MIEETDSIVSFAPHIPVGEAANLAAYIPPLPPEVFDMASLIDAVYLITAPVFVILFAIIAWFSRRSVKQNDEAWIVAGKKFDILIDKISTLTTVISVTEAKLKMHIDDKSAHNYGRRDIDG